MKIPEPSPYINSWLLNDLVEIAMLYRNDPAIQNLFEKHDIDKGRFQTESEIRDAISKLIEEICLDGGNTIANIFRGWKGVSYIEVAFDVAEKLGVSSKELDACKDFDEVEMTILNAAIQKYFAKSSDEERQKAMNNLHDVLGDEVGVDNWDVIQKIIYSGVGGAGAGIAILLETVGQQITRRILMELVMLVAGQQAALGVARFILLAVPFVNAIMGAWLLIDISGPAYRKTIPTVLTIACLRLRKQMDTSL